MPTLFVVVITYCGPLAEVDALLPAHSAFLDDGFARGIFFAAGRRVPRTGGVILAQGASRAELEGLLATDPFARHGVAQYEVIAFAAARLAPALQPLLGA